MNICEHRTTHANEYSQNHHSEKFQPESMQTVCDQWREQEELHINWQIPRVLNTLERRIFTENALEWIKFARECILWWSHFHGNYECKVAISTSPFRKWRVIYRPMPPKVDHRQRTLSAMTQRVWWFRRAVSVEYNDENKEQKYSGDHSCWYSKSELIVK